MARIKRTDEESRRIGFPSPAERLEIVEELISSIATQLGLDKSKLDSLNTKMDQLDVDFKDEK